jgi:hypothetical protein
MGRDRGRCQLALATDAETVYCRAAGSVIAGAQPAHMLFVASGRTLPLRPAVVTTDRRGVAHDP